MPIILPANTITGGYEVANSLRFDDGSSDYLNRTPSTTTNRRTFTFSTWVKKASNGTQRNIFGTAGGNDNGWLQLLFSNSDVLVVQQYSSNLLVTNAKYRDPSAWYHIVMAFDNTQATASNRIKLYVNGNQVTSFSTETYQAQNFETGINLNTEVHYIGRQGGNYFDGYMAETVLIDGQQLDATSFGEFDEDSGIWKPIDVSGLTFGTNGFYLDFENSGSLGADVSGNGNNFTVNNLTSIDQTTDTPTNNFCTLNPLSSINYPTFSEGNLKTIISTSDDNGAIARGNQFVSQGKWYWEVKLIGYSSLARVEIGVETADSVANNIGAAGLFGTGKSRGRRGDAFTIRDGNITASYGSALTTNDIVGIALDLDNGAIYFSTNGVWENSGDPESGASKTGAAFTDLANDTWSIALGQANSTYEINTGSPPYSISSGNSDANSRGNFEYSVPSGYYSLCTANLAEFG